MAISGKLITISPTSVTCMAFKPATIVWFVFVTFEINISKRLSVENENENEKEKEKRRE